MQTDLSLYVRDMNYKQIMSGEDVVLQRNLVRNAILEHPEGITDLEICISTGICRSSVCGRRNEIEGVVAVGFAKIRGEGGEVDRLNTMWGVTNYG